MARGLAVTAGVESGCWNAAAPFALSPHAAFPSRLFKEPYGRPVLIG
ncbi:MAG: hypothetical protein ACM362_07610 [Candidatus Methylomirabilota bacterium]